MPIKGNAPGMISYHSSNQELIYIYLNSENRETISLASMAMTILQVLLPILLAMVAGIAAAPPTGEVYNYKYGYASCNIKKYKYCYNWPQECPASCPNKCKVDCATCKPVCVPKAEKVRCKNKKFSSCYNTEHVCPAACPGACEVDCNTCKPVCKCDKPGAVCQDPRFIGGDGITFYFHGKKDSNFCLVSDPNLHINAHFIGKRNHNMKRDFTWVQSIAILFDNHQLSVSALKTATWEDSNDRLALTFDGEPIALRESEGAAWKSSSGVSILRDADTNSVVVEVEGKFRMTSKVVPITEEESRIHRYGITEEDCFAHLDVGFRFFSLSSEVSGVLGQTYKPDYVSRVNVGVKMPVLGGAGKEFETTSLFSPDCSVASFVGSNSDEVVTLEMPAMNCVSGMDGQGVVCRR